MSNYPYIGQLSPAVGNGLGGMPNRSSAQQLTSGQAVAQPKGTFGVAKSGNRFLKQQFSNPYYTKDTEFCRAFSEFTFVNDTANSPDLTGYTANGVRFSKDGVYCVTAGAAGLKAFKRDTSTGKFSLLFTDASLTNATARISVSNDGVYWGIAQSAASPDAQIVLKRSGDTFAKLSSAQVPNNGGFSQDVIISPDSNYLIFNSDASATTFRGRVRLGDDFTSAMTVPAGVGNGGLSWSPNGNFCFSSNPSNNTAYVMSRSGSVLSVAASRVNAYYDYAVWLNNNYILCGGTILLYFDGISSLTQVASYSLGAYQGFYHLGSDVDSLGSKFISLGFATVASFSGFFFFDANSGTLSKAGTTNAVNCAAFIP